MSNERKPTTAQVRVQPGFFSDKEATALADAIVPTLFPPSRPVWRQTGQFDGSDDDWFSNLPTPPGKP